MAEGSIDLSRQDDVWVVTFKVNAFNPAVIRELHSKLDIIEKTEGDSAVVFNSSNPKLFSGGMDLTWIMESIQAGSPYAGVDLFCQLMKLLGRMIVFPVPTISAIVGHCFAGGLMFAAACDHRIMSSDAGTVCMSEINLNLPLPQGGIDVIKAKFTPKVVKDMVLTGRRLTPQESLETKIMDKLATKDKVFSEAMAQAKELAPLGSKRVAYKLIKEELYGVVSETCLRARFTHDEMQAGASNMSSKL